MTTNSLQSLNRSRYVLLSIKRAQKGTHPQNSLTHKVLVELIGSQKGSHRYKRDTRNPHYASVRLKSLIGAYKDVLEIIVPKKAHIVKRVQWASLKKDLLGLTMT